METAGHNLGWAIKQAATPVVQNPATLLAVLGNDHTNLDLSWPWPCASLNGTSTVSANPPGPVPTGGYPAYPWPELLG